MTRAEDFRRLSRAGLLTGIVDGAFSSVLVTVFYGSTFASLWQGVASTVIGPDAFNRGATTVALGLLMHFGVAFTWSAVFLFVARRISIVRRVQATPGGALKVAAVYGPFIWMVMSLVVIPTLTGRPPAITYRWWIQFFGHIPFVAVPIVTMIGTAPDEGVADTNPRVIA